MRAINKLLNLAIKIVRHSADDDDAAGKYFSGSRQVLITHFLNALKVSKMFALAIFLLNFLKKEPTLRLLVISQNLCITLQIRF